MKKFYGKKLILKYDCSYFPGDRPCSYHKTYGIKCDNCNYYKPKGVKILIIKLDALGDVLRTTSILQGLKETYPDSYIYWLTRKNAISLFENNHYVDEVYPVENIESIQQLLPIEFDLVINLDPSKISSALCFNFKSKVKKGFGLNEDGCVYPLNKEAEPWFEMGAFDDLKKANKRTYQEIMLEICGIKTKNFDIIINLDEEELNFAKEFLKSRNIDKTKKILGINAGASPRWELKKWTDENFEKLIREVLDKTDYYIFLYGSLIEKERMEKLETINPLRIISTGYNNNLREFFALLNLSDVVLTGDTLAMHAAAALKKKVVALFGPTSSAEIEDYGRIIKVIPQLDCLVCYKMKCDFKPNCMESIYPEQVFEIIIKQMSEE